MQNIEDQKWEAYRKLTGLYQKYSNEDLQILLQATKNVKKNLESESQKETMSGKIQELEFYIEKRDIVSSVVSCNNAQQIKK